MEDLEALTFAASTEDAIARALSVCPNVHELEISFERFDPRWETHPDLASLGLGVRGSLHDMTVYGLNIALIGTAEYENAWSFIASPSRNCLSVFFKRFYTDKSMHTQQRAAREGLPRALSVLKQVVGNFRIELLIDRQTLSVACSECDADDDEEDSEEDEGEWHARTLEFDSHMVTDVLAEKIGVWACLDLTRLVELHIDVDSSSTVIFARPSLPSVKRLVIRFPDKSMPKTLLKSRWRAFLPAVQSIELNPTIPALWYMKTSEMPAVKFDDIDMFEEHLISISGQTTQMNSDALTPAVE